MSPSMQARSLALINERAQRLFEDGYRARWIDSTMVEMDSPKGETYDLDTVSRTCSCPYFTKAHGHAARIAPASISSGSQGSWRSKRAQTG